MKCLVIGEKTSQIKKFTGALCKGVTNHKHSKYIYEYHGSWTNSKKQKHDFVFLPLAGHITTIDTAKGFGWNECPPMKIAFDPKAIVVKNTRTYVTILRKLIKQGMKEIWIATDPDSEGDNIGLEVINILEKDIKKLNIKIRRIWNSSLTDKEITRSFENPKPWNDLLAWGVQGRRLIDAWLGFAGTREITRAARKVAKVKVISLGRVQLPTLYFIVYRDLLHETFQTTDRWKLFADLSKPGTPSDLIHSEHIVGYFTDEKIADTILRKLKAFKGQAIVKNTKENAVNKRPPQPLNTTAAVSLLSRLMRISANKALALMVDLYNKGLLSYPRTENSKFKNGFPHKDILSQLLRHSPFVTIIKKIKQNHQVVVNGKKKGVEEDHDPIHPTGELNGLSSLNNQQKRAWEILSRHYISLFMDDFKTKIMKVIFDISSEDFIAEGVTVIDMGWREAHTWHKNKDKPLPLLSKGDSLDIKKLGKTKNPTKPPNRLTDSNLLKAMENAKIGTKSSRPDIIKKLVERNYVSRKGRSLISTDWGRVLIASLTPIWPKVVTPEFTGHVEQLMDDVSIGSASYNSMLTTLRDEYIELHQELLSKILDYQKLLLSLNLSSQSQKTNVRNEHVIKLLKDELTKHQAPDVEEEDEIANDDL